MIPSQVYWKARIRGHGTPCEEAIIATDIIYSYHYANDIIKGRWEPGEGIIATNALYSNAYARDIIKGRWERVEPMLAQSWSWEDYLKNVFMTEEDRTVLISKYGAPK